MKPPQKISKDFLLLLALLGGYFLYFSYLFFGKKLVYYIHPKYIWLAVFAGSVLLLLLLLIFIRRPKLHLHTFSSRRILFTLFIPLLLAILFPPRPLSSLTAGQRSTNFDSLTVTNKDDLSLASGDQDTATFDVSDWRKLFEFQPSVEKHLGKSVDVTGFVFYPEHGKSGYFQVSRFVVTCCAVDARPIGLYVKIPAGKTFTADTWLRVRGELGRDIIDDIETNIVLPDSIEEVSVPENPYLN